MTERLEPRRRALAVVPARGGSKGLARKNLRLLGGKPLVAHAVAAGLAASLVDRVVCSTDDPEIAEAARLAGAEVPFLRPAELAQDTTEDLPVFVHALDWLERHEGWAPELVVDGAGADDRGALERIAVLIGGHCLVGWDTGGEPWSP